MPARYYGYKKPSTANAQPATTPPIGTIGQWTPGALSNLPTTQGVSTSQANKITTNFTDLGGGKTGSLIDAPVTDLSQMTPAFAAKAEQALSQNAIPQNASGAQAPAALFAPNTNNPFAPNFSGTPPPNPFEQAAGAEGMPQQQTQQNQGALAQFANIAGMGATYDEQGNAVNSATITDLAIMGAINEITVLGKGSWLKGILSLIPDISAWGTKGGLSAQGLEFLSKLTNKAPGEFSEIGKVLLYTKPGTIPTKKILGETTIKATSNVKTVSTIKTAVAKWFTQDKLVSYADAAGRRRWKTVQVNTLAQAAKNPWNYLKVIGAAGGFATVASYLYLNGKQSQAMGTRDVQEELKGYLGTIARDMYRDGDPVLGDMFLDMARDATNVTISAMPGGKGSVQGSNIYSEVMNETIPMLKEHYAKLENDGLMSLADGSNMSPMETMALWNNYHAQLNAEEEASNKAQTDYNNEQYLLTQQQYEINRARANSAERAADKQAAEEMAAFWLDYQKKLAALQEEEMKKQAEFWLEYRKMVIKLQEETGRSRLGFGLLR